MSELSQVGIGGAIVLLALAQMFAFLKSRNVEKTSVPCPIEVTIQLWEARLAGGIVKGLKDSISPILEGQILTIEVLNRTLENQTRIMETMAKAQTDTQIKIAEIFG